MPSGAAVAVELEDDEPLMTAKDASLYRSVAARFNYLAQDRSDMQYACKEASRRMARPRTGDWAILTRIGRYLIGAPRLVQEFVWQDGEDVLRVYTDSDLGGVQSHLPQHQRRLDHAGTALSQDVLEHTGDCGALERRNRIIRTH